MTEFILLRHGQTDWNIQRLYQGQADIPLNETGYEQAKNAGEQLKNATFDVVYCSDLSRAADTAKAVLKHHPNVPVHYDSRLRERAFGEFEGSTYQKDLMNPGILDEMNKNPTLFKFPGGESLQDVCDRAEQMLHEIKEKHPNEKVLIVSHGSFLAVFSTVLNDESLTERRKYMFNNAEPVFPAC